MGTDLARSKGRRRAATREQVLTSAETGFLERGFHGASVEWLASRAGYTTGAIYSSFRDKAGLFLAVLERRHQAQIELWRAAAAADDAEHAVVALVKGQIEDPMYLRWFIAYHEFLASSMRDPELRSTLRTQFRHFSHEFEVAMQPLASSSSLPAKEFAELVRAASNGLALFEVIEQTDDRADLMTALLARLTG
ncbi:TetR/AcrR family transcriptional regulator [Jiangella ureilytica]|uniref:TetR/AcrR family transcriptional regulator n=1 Tax=Jiangella ureilytica TaxID=2530374 RepID=A0A4R4RV70_9ACTN|nr:TetR/AcrR family transcriptional regulator [Jiangella ureilytica]TDC53259.1 TetR/AcrR family transcriptional regulator [Jiangella ureilytica]